MADKRQQVLWTSLPNAGSDDGAFLHLSVLVSPRLMRKAAVADKTLAQFPDFVDWPALVANMRFEVNFGQSAAEAEIISGPVTEIWTKIFKKETFIRSHEFEDLTGRHVVSFPMAPVHDAIRDLYADLAASASDELPAKTDLDQSFDTFRRFTAHMDDIESREKRGPFGHHYLDRLRDGEEPFGSAEDPLLKPLGRFTAYHTPLSTVERASYVHGTAGPDDPREDAEWRQFRKVKMPAAEDFKDLIDFHQMVSAMNQYPALLRMLGLVVDLRVRRDELAAAIGENWLWVTPRWEHSPADGIDFLDDILPRTRTYLGNRGLVTRSKGTGLYDEDGLLKLGHDRFRLIELDVDGTVMKLLGLGASLRTLPAQQVVRDASKEAPNRQGAPALRTGGLQLIETDRATDLETSFGAAMGFEQQAKANQEVRLYAEDLIRGLHIDVWDDSTGLWQSLCRRDGEYRLTEDGTLIETSDEEGLLRLGATASADDGEDGNPPSNPDILKLHETVFSWSGWSLSAPMPGKTINSQEPEEQPQELTNSAPPGIGLEANFKAHQGSLPSLRFGRTYKARARVVDLAGNAVAFTRADVGSPGTVSNEVKFKRFETVEPPPLALLRENTVVDEPEPGESMAVVAIRSFNETPADNTKKTVDVARRFAFAGTLKQSQIIQHGVLDTNGRLDPSCFGLLSTRDAPLPEVELEMPGAAPGDVVNVKYAVLDAGEALPFLTDPWAHTAIARLFDLPGHNPQDLIKIPVLDGAEAWPDAKPFLIRIAEEGGAPAEFSTSRRVLNVRLDKAEVVKLRLSFMLTDQEIKQSAIWDWARTKLSGSQIAAKKQLIERGQHWMITPWRTVTLVHAVQKPLITPELGKLITSRSLGSTWARPAYRTPLHAKSTAKIDLLGRWNEPMDDPSSNEAPSNREVAGHAYERKVSRNEAPTGTLDVARIPHEFGDTRYRRVLYKLEATSPFREFMPDSVKAVPDNAAIKVVSKETQTWVRSSGPPPAPDVLYVVPTFGWTRQEYQGGRGSWRSGGGLRVYMRRGWFASGYGEMLGVVLPPRNATKSQIDKPLKPYVTQWGSDPIWVSPFVTTTHPKRGDFPLRVEKREDLGRCRPDFVPEDEYTQLPSGGFDVEGLNHPDRNKPTLTLDVVPHEVGYDAERDLYFCDIVIRPGRSYFPFVRLALARYHPHSVDRAHLSPIVLAEFLQLTPDRSVVMSRDRRSPRRRRLGVYGFTYSDSAAAKESGSGFKRSVVRVTVEKMNEAIGTDLGWEPVDDAVVRPERRRLSILEAARKSALSGGAVTAARARMREITASGNFEAILAEPAVFEVLRPPSLWQGTIDLPTRPGPENRYRAVIREYEEYLTAGYDEDGQAGKARGRRTVFVETVPL